MRVCDNCGSRQAPFFPRSRSADGKSMLCTQCKSLETEAALEVLSGVKKQSQDDEALYNAMNSAIEEYLYAVSSTDEEAESIRDDMLEVIDRASPRGHVSKLMQVRVGGHHHYMAGRRYEAHDSGDGETIYHCPFCGAGGVMGRSDGTAECQFCGTSFTVQVQPSTPSMPQTIDGTPYDNPDMPGTTTEPGQPEPGAEGEEAEGQEMAVPGAGPDVQNPNPFSDGASPAKKPNPFAAILAPRFTTVQGNRLSEDDYLKHLALKHADDRGAVLTAVRRPFQKEAGGTTFRTQGTGATAEEAFRNAKSESGAWGGYSGTIAEKDSFVVWRPSVSAQEAADTLEDAQSEYDYETDKVEVGVWNRETQKLDPLPSWLPKRIFETYDDKWGPAVAIPMGENQWLFMGWASS